MVLGFAPLTVVPDNFILKVLVSEDLIQLHLDVVASMPVAMNKKAPRFLKEPFHLVKSSVQPYQIARHAALPNVGEGAQFVPVAENHIVLTTREEGWIYVYKIDALRRQLTHDVQVVAPEEAVGLQSLVAESYALDHLSR